MKYKQSAKKATRIRAISKQDKPNSCNQQTGQIELMQSAKKKNRINAISKQEEPN
jgi:hypothetical protein